MEIEPNRQNQPNPAKAAADVLVTGIVESPMLPIGGKALPFMQAGRAALAFHHSLGSSVCEYHSSSVMRGAPQEQQASPSYQ